MKQILHLPAFQWSAYPALGRSEALHSARELLELAGIRLQAVHSFSNKQIVLQICLRAADWQESCRVLAQGSLRISHMGGLPPAQYIDQDGEVWGTLAVLLPSDTDEIYEQVPMVPG